MRHQTLAALLTLAAVAACASSARSNTTDSTSDGGPVAEAPAPVTAAATITEADVRRRIEIIADDSMGGRDTPSPGLEATARYIAGELASFGLTPAGDSGRFVQRYPAQEPDDGPPIPRTRPGRTAPNVVGILEGTDPVLKNEYVLFSAHMDHVGVGAAVNGDSIFNGADDDASGTVGVIELAEAFSRPGARPKRSLIFLTVSGEEKGLWGSKWFTAHPPVPLANIVADLNIDMIGRNWKDTIVAIGKEHSDLGATLARVNAAHPELGMHAIDDLWPQESFYTRSDHYNFARRGVPVLFFFNGTHADYHGVDDEPARIDAEKEARIVRLVYFIGQDVANAPQRPKMLPRRP
jgi:peptidase M28-like protein